ncbi:uncharacterized protein BDW43DRAFT_300903 [Aspergillus alliaceus]|uniref:uncharacterized protein n=1 Tax=Petromyces alliaceus TaxID=209559 RepID=UPI0012A3B32C|nr:uncharacterized protein BDW43DRAFT_300903 [Aspergillus alliaceus]KAB8232548.1 hypothetical protein BDW43DRAFT_300903 [Aspergillus alliaceus]
MKLSAVISLLISGVTIASALPSIPETADCVKPYLCCGELKTPLDSTVDPILKDLGINAASLATPGIKLVNLGRSAALKPTSSDQPIIIDSKTNLKNSSMIIATSGLIPPKILSFPNSYGKSKFNAPHHTNPSLKRLSIYPFKAKGDAPYSVAEDILRAAIHIPKSFSCDKNKKIPVLLVPGTAVPAAMTFYYNFGKLGRALPETDIVWVNIPRASLDDIQSNAEYVAYALNYISALCLTKAAVISWSQGALNIQWALKYWPSTRDVVSDFIAISPDFHGTMVRWLVCPFLHLVACTPSIWQQGWDAKFIQVLRSRGGDSAYVPTTTIYSSFDQVVKPMSGGDASAILSDQRGVGVSNNHLQTICANQAAGGVYTHEGVLYNPLAWALAADALRHDGPGNITRIDTRKLPEIRALKFNIAYFDRESILIWAGSCLFDNRNIFDFTVVPTIDGGSHSSCSGYQDSGKDKRDRKAVSVTNDLGAFNMHEFNILNGGKTALACSYRNKYKNLGNLGRPNEYGWVVSGGFVEMDTITGKVLYDWDSEGCIPIHESVKVGPSTPASGEPERCWNYILSARFTNTIYLISGQDGHIVWRLGGENSDFAQDFTFSKQHHVRFLEQGELTSAALIVQLHTSVFPMTAKAIARYNRPDGVLTRLRGSVQKLPIGEVFHSPEGKVLMQASFASLRFSTYRSYKFDFTGQLSTPPDVVSSVYGTDETELTSIFHGTLSRLGIVEAMDKDGNVLGTFDVRRTETLNNWRLAGFQGDVKPTPHDRSIIYGDKAVADDADDVEETYLRAEELIHGVGGLLIFVLVLCSTGGTLAGVYLHFWRRSMQAYNELASEEGEPLNERSI